MTGFCGIVPIMRDKIIVFLANGFEEIEAIATIDMLRRAGLNVETASISDKITVAGAHSIPVICDNLVSELNPERIIMTICPGGMPGAENLASSREVTTIIRSVVEAGGWAAAICAAPIALNAAGVLNNLKYTCYPSFEMRIGGQYTGSRVECSDKIITACGPGATYEFALAIIQKLAGDAKAEQVRKGMLIKG